MNYTKIIISILVMALVTYLPRVLPIAIFRKKIQNRFIRSFLIYMPYGVLAAMVFPDVLFSTGNLISALLGTITALILSYKKWTLLPVAISSTAVVFITEQILNMIK